jgi:hypothetical protein
MFVATDSHYNKVLEWTQAGGEPLLSAIHKLMNSVWNMKELPDHWKEYITVPVQ